MPLICWREWYDQFCGVGICLWWSGWTQVGVAPATIETCLLPGEFKKTTKLWGDIRSRTAPNDEGTHLYWCIFLFQPYIPTTVCTAPRISRAKTNPAIVCSDETVLLQASLTTGWPLLFLLPSYLTSARVNDAWTAHTRRWKVHPKTAPPPLQATVSRRGRITTVAPPASFTRPPDLPAHRLGGRGRGPRQRYVSTRPSRPSRKPPRSPNPTLGNLVRRENWAVRQPGRFGDLAVPTKWRPSTGCEVFGIRVHATRYTHCTGWAVHTRQGTHTINF